MKPWRLFDHPFPFRVISGSAASTRTLNSALRPHKMTGWVELTFLVMNRISTAPDDELQIQIVSISFISSLHYIIVLLPLITEANSYRNLSNWAGTMMIWSKQLARASDWCLLPFNFLFKKWTFTGNISCHSFSVYWKTIDFLKLDRAGLHTFRLRLPVLHILMFIFGMT